MLSVTGRSRNIAVKVTLGTKLRFAHDGVPKIRRSIDLMDSFQESVCSADSGIPFIPTSLQFATIEVTNIDGIFEPSDDG